MKKYLYLLLAVICLSNVSKAAPGDTTWVQANNTQMTYPGNFDSTIYFPTAGKTYRKILMVCTLGKYNCNNGNGYCGSYDYVVSNYIMKKNGDTAEVSRLITPYATTSLYFPLTWTYDYIFDVTDYAAMLQDSAVVRVNYSGFSYGFFANVRYAFIEGTPDRNVVGIQRLWHGGFGYGMADAITNHVYTLTDTVPAGTVSADMKMRITGHGEDSLNCCEFYANTYSVLLNNNNIATQNLIRDCGQNPIYSQTGTWPFNRANWCPGALVNDIYYPLSVTSGSSYNIDVTFPPYVWGHSNSGNDYAQYIIEAASIYYGAINKTLDASLEEIIAPNSAPQYSRTNAVCGNPTIHVHNSGSTTITSLSINYGVTGGAVNNYVWSGSLPALQDADVILPSIEPLVADAGLTTVQNFTATVAQVNGQTDEDATNNTLTSSFTPTPLLTNKLIIKMQTSTYLDPTSTPQGWQILDMNDNVVAQHTNMQQETQYKDTITLGLACYKLVITTPDGLGLTPGNYYQQGSGVSNGSFSMYKITVPNAALSLPNYHGGDFGDGITQYFSTTTVLPASVPTIVSNNLSLEAYPNPAQNAVTINIGGLRTVNGTIKMIDMLGRTVIQQHCNSDLQTLNISGLSNGVYSIVYVDAGSPDSKLQTRLLIAK